ncbi:MAG TPA: class I SAM-dependent methyltransferase [Candidatus Korarchaeota archaeon]|nr:class I SAM-dependent methyltransferase [Candidatus Korarchaeota archaeon]
MPRSGLLYTVLAHYYDIIYRDYLERTVPRLIDFVEEVFKRDARIPVRKILDLACGTGGPTIELARRGYEVTGLDLHEEMLSIAREKVKRIGLSIPFIRGDARELGFVEEFDAVTMFFTSISYMTRLDDLRKLMRGVYNSLKSGGLFIADSPNPYEFVKRLGESPGPQVWDVEAPSGERILITDYKELEDVKGIVHFKRVITVIDDQGNSRTYLMDDPVRLYTSNELRATARDAGFPEVRIYGDLRVSDDEPRNARRLFLVATK